MRKKQKNQHQINTDDDPSTDTRRAKATCLSLLSFFNFSFKWSDQQVSTSEAKTALKQSKRSFSLTSSLLSLYGGSTSQQKKNMNFFKLSFNKHENIKKLLEKATITTTTTTKEAKEEEEEDSAAIRQAAINYSENVSHSENVSLKFFLLT